MWCYGVVVDGVSMIMRWGDFQVCSFVEHENSTFEGVRKQFILPVEQF